jgi:hypothetical protein
LREAQQLVSSGQGRQAAAQLDRARAFHRDVGADLYLSEEEALASAAS